MLLGVSGLAGSGKSEISNFLEIQYNFNKVAFADPIKSASSFLFDMDIDDFYIPHRKEVENAYWGMSPRKIMQTFGTECMRHNFGEDFWTRKMEMRLNKIDLTTSYVVIEDVRHADEVELIERLGGVIIGVERDLPKKQISLVQRILQFFKNQKVHESERFTSVAPSLIVKNNGSKKDLYRKVTQLMKEIQGPGWLEDMEELYYRKGTSPKY